MDFLRNEKRFDFLYGGKAFAELEYKVSYEENENMLKTTYLLADGLKITNIATKYDNAYEWVNWLENTGDKETEVISELWDAAVTVKLPHEDPLR